MRGDRGVSLMWGRGGRTRGSVSELDLVCETPIQYWVIKCSNPALFMYVMV